MFRMNGKKYPQSAAEAAREKEQESMECVYAGPEQMREQSETIIKCVYAGPDFFKNRNSDGQNKV